MADRTMPNIVPKRGCCARVVGRKTAPRRPLRIPGPLASHALFKGKAMQFFTFFDARVHRDLPGPMATADTRVVSPLFVIPATAGLNLCPRRGTSSGCDWSLVVAVSIIARMRPGP